MCTELQCALITAVCHKGQRIISTLQLTKLFCTFTVVTSGFDLPTQQREIMSTTGCQLPPWKTAAHSQEHYLWLYCM